MMIAAACLDGFLSIRNVVSDEDVESIKIDRISCLCFKNFTEESTALSLAIGDHPVINTWNTESKSWGTQYTCHLSPPSIMRFNGDNSKLIGVCRRGYVYFWDTETGVLLRTFRLARKALAMHPLINFHIAQVLSTSMASCSLDFLETNTTLGGSNPNGSNILDSPNLDFIAHVEQSADDQLLVVSSSDCTFVSVWRTEDVDGRKLQLAECSLPHNRNIGSLVAKSCFHPNYGTVVMSVTDQSLTLWEWDSVHDKATDESAQSWRVFHQNSRIKVYIRLDLLIATIDDNPGDWECCDASFTSDGSQMIVLWKCGWFASLDGVEGTLLKVWKPDTRPAKFFCCSPQQPVVLL